MTICYGWIVDQQIILTCMEGVVPAHRFKQWADELNPFYDQTPHDKLHLIVDGKGLRQLPSIKEMLDIPIHEKRGWIVIVGLPNKLLLFLASLVVQLTHTDLKFASTLDEAYLILQHVDQNLPEAISPPIQWIQVIPESERPC